MDSHAVRASKSGDLLEAVQASDIPKRDERVILCRPRPADPVLES